MPLAQTLVSLATLVDRSCLGPLGWQQHKAPAGEAFQGQEPRDDHLLLIASPSSSQPGPLAYHPGGHCPLAGASGARHPKISEEFSASLDLPHSTFLVDWLWMEARRVLAEGLVDPPLIPFLACQNSMAFQGLCSLLVFEGYSCSLLGPVSWVRARRSAFSPIPDHYSAAAVGTR